MTTAARGRRAAIATAAVGLAVLAGAAIAGRRPIEEAWQIHRLRAGDIEAKKAAARRLGEMGSIRGLPDVISFSAGVSGVEEDGPLLGLDDSDGAGTVSCHALLDIIRSRGREAVPYLLGVIDGPDEKQRTLSILLLGWIGRDAREAAPRLRPLLDGPKSEIRTQAAFALASMGEGTERTAHVLLELWDHKRHFSGDFEDRCVIEALGQCGKAAAAAIPEVEKAKDYSDPEIRNAAAAALKKIRGE